MTHPRDTLARNDEAEFGGYPPATSRESGERPAVRLDPGNEHRASIEEAPRPSRDSGPLGLRREPRAQVAVSVAFQRDGQTLVRAVATNLSLGGAFIRTLAPAPFGARVLVLLPLPGLGAPAVVRCVVRWVDDSGMGVQFGLLGARETHALMQLLR